MTDIHVRLGLVPNAQRPPAHPDPGGESSPSTGNKSYCDISGGFPLIYVNS